MSTKRKFKIVCSGFDQNGNLSIWYNDTPYTYYQVTEYDYSKINIALKFYNYKSVKKILKRYKYIKDSNKFKMSDKEIDIFIKALKGEIE